MYYKNQTRVKHFPVSITSGSTKARTLTTNINSSFIVEGVVFDMMRNNALLETGSFLNEFPNVRHSTVPEIR